MKDLARKKSSTSIAVEVNKVSSVSSVIKKVEEKILFVEKINNAKKSLSNLKSLPI